MKLEDKVAIVTGAGRGIGKATAFLLAEEGAEVCCNSVSDSAADVAGAICAEGRKAIFVRGDASDPADSMRIVAETVSRFGRIDILFNNAGVVIPGSIEDLSLSEWERTMSVNVRSAFLMSKYVLPYLKESKGTIVNNASAVALKGVKDRAAYTASKGAILSMSRAMAVDLIDFGIRVNCICPGTTLTPSLEERFRDSGDVEKAMAEFTARQPLGRLGSPEEIAGGVLYLVNATFCTGVALIVDGGMTV